MSRGRIDGAKHRAPGRRTGDRSARPTVKDWAWARAAVAYFEERWDLRTWEADREAVATRCRGFVELQRRVGWDIGEEGCTDFITTLRAGLHHEPLQHLPRVDPDSIWPIGTLGDAPAATALYEMRFVCERPAQFHVTSMPETFIVRHEAGTLLWDGGVPVGGRAPKQLPAVACTELVRVFYALLRLRRFRSRGAACCSISRNFVVTGIKSDYTTKLAYPYVTEEEEVGDGLRAHEATVKLRALFENYVLPIIIEYFDPFFNHVGSWARQFGIHLFSNFVSAAGLAELYWPRSHVDMDKWYTILVTLDLGAGIERGADFSFAEMGHILKAAHGDVFFFNPSCKHSCTEPHPRPGGSRIFISFYCKRDAVNAAALSAAMAARKGNAPLSLCRIR